MSDAVQDSDALYYPYINIRDEAWLKTTLLYFPHVVRMVPPNYLTNANGFMRTLTQTRGARNEPLLGSYFLRSYAADDAVDRLTGRLLDDARQDPSFAGRFSRAATHEAYGQDAESFQIHRGKAPQVFWDELKKLGMMWPPLRRVRGGDRDEWAALHPLLGEAFMATVAIAAAKERGMEIVTDAPGVHRATACRDEEAIYQMLIRHRAVKRHSRRRLQDSITGQKEQLDNPKGEMTLRLAHLIVVGNFDVSALSAHDLAEMSKNREALLDFRRDLGRRVAEIPAMSSESERERRLQAAANDAIDAWRKSLPNMSKFARRFFGLGLLDKSEKTMTDLQRR